MGAQVRTTTRPLRSLYLFLKIRYTYKWMLTFPHLVLNVNCKDSGHPHVARRPHNRKVQLRGVDDARTHAVGRRVSTKRAHEVLLWLGYQMKLREQKSPGSAKRASKRDTRQLAVQALKWLGQMVA